MNYHAAVETKRLLSSLTELAVDLRQRLPETCVDQWPTVINTGARSQGRSGKPLEAMLADARTAEEEVLQRERHLLNLVNGLESKSRGGSASGTVQIPGLADLCEEYKLAIKKCLTKSDDLLPTFSSNVEHFVQIVDELRILMKDNLQTTFEEDRQREDHLREVSGRDKKASSQCKTLQKELAKEQKERESILRNRDELIQKLRDEILEKRKDAANNTEDYQQSLQESEVRYSESYDATKAELEKELNSLCEEFDKTLSENRATESHWSKRKLKNEQEVENWIRKYDEEMDAKTRELMELTEAFNKDQKRLDWLKGELGVLVEDRNKVESEEEAERARKKAEAVLLQQKHDTATRFQALFRGYMQRKRLDQMNKKKAKGDKKSQKKGSKKPGRK